MKYLSLTFLGLVCILFLSCTKEKDVLFEGKINATFEIPAGANVIETYYILVKNVPTFYLLSANAAGANIDNVNSIQSAKGLIRSTFQAEDYDFIERISVFVSPKSDPTLKREMYYVDFVQFSTDEELRLQGSTGELKDIIKDETIDIEIRINFREFVTRNIPSTIELGYTVF